MKTQNPSASGLRFIKIGGVLNLVFAIGHLGFWKLFDWPLTLAGISGENRAILYVLNIHLALQLLVFCVFSLFYAEELLETRIGKAILFYVSFFWVFRAVEEFIFFGQDGRSIVFFLILIGVGMLYLVPFYRVVRKDKFFIID